jgi:hypothetical protein
MYPCTRLSGSPCACLRLHLRRCVWNHRSGRRMRSGSFSRSTSRNKGPSDYLCSTEALIDVLYLKEPRGTVRTPANWSDLRALLRDSQLFGGAVLDYGRTLPTASQNQPWLADGQVQPWWEAARQLDSATDLRNALRVLPNDADALDRITAAVVLMNFPAEDSV